MLLDKGSTEGVFKGVVNALRKEPLSHIPSQKKDEKFVMGNIKVDTTKQSIRNQLTFRRNWNIILVRPQMLSVLITLLQSVSFLSQPITVTCALFYFIL